MLRWLRKFSISHLTHQYSIDAHRKHPIRYASQLGLATGLPKTRNCRVVDKHSASRKPASPQWLLTLHNVSGMQPTQSHTAHSPIIPSSPFEQTIQKPESTSHQFQEQLLPCYYQSWKHLSLTKDVFPIPRSIFLQPLNPFFCCTLYL